MSNRLAREASPYLRQHADNPVDWYPWGEEALAKAKAEDKPILLSVGYSACHWCHVMAHESFENAHIAAVMNERFVNIKVDREERPDLDQIYQNVAQLITRGGGWPLTVFLTPDLQPFFGGTYFPPDDRYGRPGFERVLISLSEMYKNSRSDLLENAERLTDAISKLESVGNESQENQRPNQHGFEKIIGKLLQYHDEKNGGFGSAPKFPNTMNLTLLWRYGLAKDNKEAQSAAILSLVKMAGGGIYDHLGGGFARYSTDETWTVPHFEKMLYDNGLLLKLYSEVLLTEPNVLTAAHRELFTRTVRETVEYVLREMTSPSGGFYSAQDADSEGVEGKFFVWSKEEIETLLDADERDEFLKAYNVTSHGNFEHSTNVLERREPLSRITKVIDQAREKLFQARSHRVAPGRDDKVLTSWNGLMISGLVWASQALKTAGEDSLATRAWKAANDAYFFVTEKMTFNGDRLHAVYSDHADPKARFNGYLDDYAFMADAALDLARFEERDERVSHVLDQSRAWLNVILEHFKDEDGTGYFFTSDDHEKLLQRPKTLYDQAIPAGISVTLRLLAVFAEAYPEDRRYEDELEAQLMRIFPQIIENPFGLGEAACVSFLRLQGPALISGPQSPNMLPVHPHLYRKPGPKSEPGKLLLCHEKSCREVAADELKRLLRSR